MKNLLITSRYIKKNIFYLLLVLILLYGFLIRFHYMGNSFRFADAYRDYLVGRNIVRENSFVLIGPHNGAFETLSSPVYFYLIASILAINQNILFLEFVLILLQLLSIYTIFLIGKNLFSAEAGFVAATLYSFSRIILQQANFIWQPNLMQPIFVFSLYFLILAYKRNKFIYFLISAILATLAIALYNSALGMIIPIIISFYIVFRKNDWGMSKMIFAILTVAILSFLFYLPPVFYQLSHNKDIVLETTQSLEPVRFLERLPQNLKYSLHLNSYHIRGVNETNLVYQDLMSNILLLTIIILTIFYLLERKIGLNKKLTILILILFIISPSFISSFSKSFIQARHFFLILVPVSLLLGEIISKKLSNSFPQLLVKLVLVILLVKSFMLSLQDFNLFLKTQQANGQLDSETFNEIRSDIIKTKSEYNLDNFNFFQFNIFPNTPEINGWSDAEFWIKLEDSFNIKFTKNDDSSLYLAYRPINNNQFVYLICDIRVPGSGSSDRCLNNFLQTGRYKYVRKVTQDSLMSVFLTKKPS